MGAMNELINPSALDRLERQLLASGSPELPTLRASASQLDDLSLRERADHVSAALLADLPTSYVDVAALVRRALTLGAFRGWTMWPIAETVVSAALADGSPEAFDDGLELLGEITPRLTSEFSIRRLLAVHPDRALAAIQVWTQSDDEHVRRLASEGTRPFLPWAVRVPVLLKEPQATLPILNALYRDESDYVRRSVANHLNDLARQNPELVVETAARWLAAPVDSTPQLVRHALRTLIKRGYTPALELMGFRAATVSVSTPLLNESVVPLPGALAFSFDVTNDGAEPAQLAVDYVVHYLKANGTRAPKVFKLAAPTIAAGATMRFSKRHAVKQMTTRVHYPGTHAVEIQVNGERFGEVEFELVDVG